MKKIYLVVLSVLCITPMAIADIPSTRYVDAAVEKRVSTEQTAEQTLHGKYVVSGTLEVETPRMPSEFQ